MNFLEQFGESFEGADVEGGVEDLMENLGLQDILDTLKTMFADLGPQLEAMFGDLDIDSWFGGDDEENQTPANRGALPEQLQALTIPESTQEHAGYLRQVLTEHVNLIGSVLALPGNIGDSPTAIATTRNFDPSRPVKFVYHFHGLNSQNPTATGRFDQTLSALENSGENAVLIYPLNRNQAEHDDSWMNGQGDNGSFDTMHASVLSHFQDNGIHLNSYEVVAQGHSAGGKALRNIAQSGSTQVNRFVFLDASYGAWARDAHRAANTNYSTAGENLDMQVFFIEEPESNRIPERPDNTYTRSLIGEDNITLYSMRPGGGIESVDHGGAIDHFFAGTDSSEFDNRILSA